MGADASAASKPDADRAAHRRVHSAPYAPEAEPTPPEEIYRALSATGESSADPLPDSGSRIGH